jgi:hypothetical protein
MVSKYENMTNEDIIENYKRLKELQRQKNKASYEKLKLNKVKYRNRLTYELEQQNKRIENIKLDEETYNYFKECEKIHNSNYYNNKKLKNYKLMNNIFVHHRRNFFIA